MGRSYVLEPGDRIAFGRPENEMVFGSASDLAVSPAHLVLTRQPTPVGEIPPGSDVVRLADPLLNAGVAIDPRPYGTTAAMISAFEGGAEVWKNEYTPQTGPTRTIYSLIPMGSGQSGTIDPRHATREDYEAFERWRAARGIHHHVTDSVAVQGPVSPQFRTAAARLTSTLNERGVPHRHLPQGSANASGHSLHVLADVIAVLPDTLLQNGYLQGIEVESRSRIQAAAMSAYNDGWVHIYRMMHQAGGVRNLTLLATHEIGHSTAERYGGSENRPDPNIPAEIRQRMHAAHQTITRQGQHFGLDYCGGPKYRKGYQGNFVEFIAEMHAIYVYAGDALRAHIKALPAGSPEREAWEFVYAEFRDRIFGGREYTFEKDPTRVAEP
jgi:hypothetical protein